MPTTSNSFRKSKSAVVILSLTTVVFMITQQIMIGIASDKLPQAPGRTLIEQRNITERQMSNFDRFIIPSYVAMAFGASAKLFANRHARIMQDERDDQAQAILAKLETGENPPPFFLYLRSFSITGNTPVQYYEHGHNRFGGPPPKRDFEYVLSAAVAADGPLIGLGRPGEALGVGRVATDDQSWRQKVEGLICKARTVFLVPLATPGTKWEVDHLLGERLLGKTVFVMPPESRSLIEKAKIRPIWEAALKFYAEKGIEMPTYESSGMLFRVGDGGSIVSKVSIGNDPDELRTSFTELHSRSDLQSILDAPIRAHCPNCGAVQSRLTPPNHKMPRANVCVRCGAYYIKPLRPDSLIKQVGTGFGLLLGAAMCASILLMLTMFKPDSIFAYALYGLMGLLLIGMLVGGLGAFVIVASSVIRSFLARIKSSIHRDLP
ncbi:MAG: hypothetical protein ACJ8C4_15320 [Gemmataceae bacterium]